MDVILTGFFKKPLVALTLLALVSMCLSIAEAAPRTLEHRRRHHRSYLELDPTNPSKDSRPANPNTSVKPRSGLYKNATLKIIKRLKNTKRFFKQGLRELNESRKRVNGNPVWLPKMNFVDVQHRSKKIKSLKCRFLFLMPKLYKHLLEYQAIFERLKNVEIVHQDDMYHNINRRKKFLSSILYKLDSFITEVTDAMDSVHKPIPKFEISQKKLTTLQLRVDGTHSGVQDHIAYRGYENLLKNWELIFKCPKTRKGKKLLRLCKNFKVKNVSKSESERVYTLRKSLFRSENLV